MSQCRKNWSWYGTVHNVSMWTKKHWRIQRQKRTVNHSWCGGWTIASVPYQTVIYTPWCPGFHQQKITLVIHNSTFYICMSAWAVKLFWSRVHLLCYGGGQWGQLPCHYQTPRSPTQLVLPRVKSVNCVPQAHFVFIISRKDKLFKIIKIKTYNYSFQLWIIQDLPLPPIIQRPPPPDVLF